VPEIGNGSSVAVNIDGHVTNTNNPEMSQSMVENKVRFVGGTGGWVVTSH